jgi:primosomal protein N' (replication factor Y)
MFAEIIPNLRLPKNINTFTYLVPEELKEEIKMGQIVEVPFRNRRIQGVVLELKDKIDFPLQGLKPIFKIFNPNPLLTENQFKIIDWFSKYYQISRALVAKTILPIIPKRKIKIKEPNFKNLIPTDTYNKEQIEKNARQFIESKNKKFFLNYTKEIDQWEFYHRIIEKMIKENKQVLILFPELSDINSYGFNENIALLHGQLNRNQYYGEWQKIIENKAKIALGSRLAVFAPFKNLGLIIIDKAHDQSHKQWDMNPRYDAREVAQKISELTGAKIIFASRTPNLELYFKSYIQNEYEPLELKSELGPQIKIIDLREERRKKNYSILSEELQNEIGKNLKVKKQIFLFINRRGQANSVSCADCGHIFTCPNCRLPLALHASNQLKCHHCSYSIGLPLFCPNCHGPELKFLGGGTQKIENEIKKLFPEIKILRIDNDADIKKFAEYKNCSSVESDFSCHKFNIIIGTQLAMKFIDWKKIGLVGIISADTLLYIPDFRSLERTYQLFSELIFNTFENSPRAKFIIQTYNPENRALKAIAKNDLLDLYNQELEERKEFAYPPFSRLVKLTFSHPNEKKVIFESRRLWQELNKKIYGEPGRTIGQEKNITLTTPKPAYTTKIRNRFQYQIIIKLPADFDLSRKNFLDTVPGNWIIDIDPESLL